MTATTRAFDILPALHLSKGRLVDLASQTNGDIPVLDEQTDQLEAARRAIEHGAQWLHVVNVDTSFDSSVKHDWQLIKQLCSLPIKVQYGGGLHNAENIDKAIESGVTRVVLNTLAISSPEIVAAAIIKHGRERFALSINASPEGKVLGRDWQAVDGFEQLTLAVQMSQLGITTLVHTRLDPDGTMTGTELQNSAELASLSGMDVIVGGEVRDLDDVIACYNCPGITGVLIGKALQTGKFGLEEALDETRAALAFESGMPRWKEEQQEIRVRLRRSLALHYLIRHVPDVSGLQVLDAGGGNGLSSMPLLEFGAQISVVDRSMAMLEDLKTLAQASGYPERIVAYKEDIRNIHKVFSQDTFDCLICHNVIQYSPDWESLLTSMSAPLKSGAILSLVVRNWYAEPYRIDVADHEISDLPDLLDRTSGPSHVFDANVLFFSTQFLQDWLQRQGFSVLDDYGLLCRPDPQVQVESQGEEQIRFEKLHELERAMGERAPYKHTARYLQIIARKG